MSYAVVNMKTGEVVREYASDGVPSSVVWPNGDATFAIAPGHDHGPWRFVKIAYATECPGEFYRNTKHTPKLAGDTLTYERTWEPDDLATVQAALITRLDDRAEAERAKVITLGSGQAMTYWEKLAEARACVLDQDPSDDKYPLLAATIGYDGKSVQEVSETVLSRYAEWLKIGAAIESVRRKTKAAMAQAKDVDAAVATFNAAIWP